MNRTLAGYATAALVDLLNGAVVLSLPYAALALNAGSAGTVANLAAAVTYATVCALSTRRRPFSNRGTTLVVGAGSFAAALLLLGLVPAVPALFAAGVLAGGGLGLFFPALQSWFTEGMSEAQVVKTMGTYVVCWVGGFLVGPYLAGHVLDVDLSDLGGLGQRVRWLALGGGAVAASIALFFAFGSFAAAHPSTADKAEPADGHDSDAIARPTADPGLRRLFLSLMWLATFSSAFSIALVRYLFTEMAKGERLSPALVGSVNSVMYVALIALVLAMRHWRFWVFRLRYVLLFQALAVPAVAGFVLTTHPAFYVAGAALIGASHGFVVFAAPAYALMVEEGKDRNIGLYESLVGVGSLSSGAVGVLVAGWLGAKASFVPGLIVLVGALALEVVVYARWRRVGLTVSNTPSRWSSRT